MREVVGWKKVWADHKTHLKAKLRKNRINFSGTCGGTAKICSFTALEQSVINLLQMKEAVDGMSGVRKFGANSTYTTGDDSATGTSNNAEQDVYTVHDYMCNQHDMEETLSQWFNVSTCPRTLPHGAKARVNTMRPPTPPPMIRITSEYQFKAMLFGHDLTPW